jgi:hypothetical protein
MVGSGDERTGGVAGANSGPCVARGELMTSAAVFSLGPDAGSSLSARGAWLIRGALLAAAFALNACSSGGWSAATIGAQAANDPVSPDYPVAYIKRALPSTTDPNAKPLADDLRVQRGQKIFNGPADVFLRLQASPTAAEKNLTGAITNGTWDVRDLDVSFDGTLLIFSMRQPLMKNTKADEQPTWQLYTYNLSTGVVARVIASDVVAAEGNDVGAHFLPDGRIVFASTRQRGEKAVLIDENHGQFVAGVESNRNEPHFSLHVMNADGSDITQIEYNESHDLDPTVMVSGQVAFTRWDSPDGNEQGMHLYSVNADGSDLKLLYGKYSHLAGALNTQPAGQQPVPLQFVKTRSRQDGKLVAMLRPYPDVALPANVTAWPLITSDGTAGGNPTTEFGGDLALIDVQNYVENAQGVFGVKVGANGPFAQSRLVVNSVQTVPGPSPGGRFASVYPLWDGTNRLLVSWSPCRVVTQPPAPMQILPCTTQDLATTAVTTAAPLYGIWIYDPVQNTQLPIVAPVEGMMYTEVVAMQPRVTPTVPVYQVPVAGVSYDQSLADAQVGVIDIKSVYDIDGVDASAAGIAALRDPMNAAYAARPARFVRLEKAVGLPDKETLKELPNSAFGAANYMREILGYGLVDPDGSVKLEVPANVAFMISILDVNGQRIGGIHNNWMHVRAGEVLTCNGCHSVANGQQMPLAHGRDNLFDSGNMSANPGAPNSGQPFPNTSVTVLGGAGAVAGETMAEARIRAACPSAQVPGSNEECTAMRPSMDIVGLDVWTAQALPSVLLQYASLNTLAPSDPNCYVGTPAPPVLFPWHAQCRGVIHYPQHIQPLWSLDRTTIPNPTWPVGLLAQDGTPATSCVSCHTTKGAAGAELPAGNPQFDLTDPAAATMAQTPSFQELLFPHEPLQLIMGALVPATVPGPIDPKTGLPTQVPAPMVGPIMVGGSARASTLFFPVFQPGGSHFGYLSPAELRLIGEWLDDGAQYFNDPFAIPAGFM